MTVHAPVRRLNNDLHHLRVDQRALKVDVANKQKALDAFVPAGTTAAVRNQQVRDHFDPIIRRDKKDIAGDRKKALHDLHPAELQLSLKQINVDRRALGLHKLSHRPINTHTVQGCAQALLHSKNVSFWSGLSTGSDRKNLQLLAEGKRAFVPATGGHVTPKLKMMQALVAMSQRGHIMINALTGGHHSTGSNHYSGHAVDLDLSTGNHGMIEKMARRYGGQRNFETSHIHLDF